MCAVNPKFYKTIEDIFSNDPGFFLSTTVMAPQNVTVPHSHEFTECVFITGGTGMHRSAQQKPIPISRGDILFIPPGGVHEYTQASDDLFLINLLFDTAHLPPVLLELYAQSSYKILFLRDLSHYDKKDFPIFHPPEEIFDELESFARHLVRFCAAPGNHFRKLGMFMVLLSLLSDAYGSSEQKDEMPELDIPKLTDFMQNNLQREIYLEELSRLASMSNTTLVRHFKASMGCTPMVYLRKLRLKHAAELLINSNFSIKETADNSGFFSEAYFFRSFKEHYGVTPSEFRRDKQDKTDPGGGEREKL